MLLKFLRLLGSYVPKAPRLPGTYAPKHPLLLRLLRIYMKILRNYTLRRLIIVPGVLITSPWVVLVVLVLVFVVPGVVLVVVDVVASHYVY